MQLNDGSFRVQTPDSINISTDERNTEFRIKNSNIKKKTEVKHINYLNKKLEFFKLYIKPSRSLKYTLELECNNEKGIRKDLIFKQSII